MQARSESAPWAPHAGRVVRAGSGRAPATSPTVRLSNAFLVRPQRSQRIVRGLVADVPQRLGLRRRALGDRGRLTPEASAGWASGCGASANAAARARRTSSGDQRESTLPPVARLRWGRGCCPTHGPRLGPRQDRRPTTAGAERAPSSRHWCVPVRGRHGCAHVRLRVIQVCHQRLGRGLSRPSAPGHW